MSERSKDAAAVVVALAVMLEVVLSTKVVMVVLESVLLGINYRRLLWRITQK